MGFLDYNGLKHYDEKLKTWVKNGFLTTTTALDRIDAEIFNIKAVLEDIKDYKPEVSFIKPQQDGAIVFNYDGNFATGSFASAFGQDTSALGVNSFAAGESTIALGKNCFAAGSGTIAGGKAYYYTGINPDTKIIYLSELTEITPFASRTLPAFGNTVDDSYLISSMTTPMWAQGDYLGIINNSHFVFAIKVEAVQNNKVTYSGDLPFDKIPYNNQTPDTGDDSYTIFNLSKPTVGAFVLGHLSTVFGDTCNAAGSRSFATGYGTIAYSFGHAEGSNTIAGYAAHAEGSSTEAIGRWSHAEGGVITVSGVYKHNVASGDCSHVEGQGTFARGTAAHAENLRTSALSPYSHAEGELTTAEGQSSHAEGLSSKAIGKGSHAEGDRTTANGGSSHAEGVQTFAGYAAHSEGSGSIAKNSHSHAEGYYTEANANGAHAEGSNTIASGKYSHAGGIYTKATAEGQTAIGKYNKTNSKALFIIGNGTGDEDAARSNAFEVLSDGSVIMGGKTFTPSMLQQLYTMLGGSN